MMQLLAIAGGGAIGALIRFYASTGVHHLMGRDFPYGTLFVNVAGSLLMGFLYILFLERVAVSPAVRAGVLVGILGAFTTFSTFSVETLALIESGDTGRAMMNIVLSVVLCLAMAWVGMLAARQW